MAVIAVRLRQLKQAENSFHPSALGENSGPDLITSFLRTFRSSSHSIRDFHSNSDCVRSGRK